MWLNIPGFIKFHLLQALLLQPLLQPKRTDGYRMACSLHQFLKAHVEHACRFHILHIVFEPCLVNMEPAYIMRLVGKHERILCRLHLFACLEHGHGMAIELQQAEQTRATGLEPGGVLQDDH